jgi:hypothetical protein
VSYDLSSSIEGVRSAWRSLEQAAHRIATGSVEARRQPVPGGEIDPLPAGPSGDQDTVKIDLAKELLDMDQARIAIKANLRVVSASRELDHEILDILA